MSNFQPSGISLQAAGASAFQSALDNAASAMGKFESAVTSVVKPFSALGEVFTGFLRRIGEIPISLLEHAFRNLSREVTRFISNEIQAAAEGSALETTLSNLHDRITGITKAQFSPLFAQLDALVKKAGPSIESFVQYAEGAFVNLASNAITYGQNIVTSLAQGIFNGAGAVIDALITIGNLITGFLQPGSPPKLLPDLDDWGREAANVYLGAWAKADFSIFRELASPIEAALRSLSGSNNTNLIPNIIGSREAIAQAIQQVRETGTVTESSLQAIFSAVGKTTQGMQAYIRASFQLQVANQKVTAAQDTLNSATRRYQELLKPLDDAIAGINEEQSQLAENQRISMLQLVANDPNATASEKRQAALELERILAERNRRAMVLTQGAAVEAAQGQLDAAKAEQVATQENFDAKRALIDLETEQNRLLSEQLSLMDRLAKSIDAIGEAVKAVKAASGGGGKKTVVPQEVEEFDWADFIPQSLLDKITELKKTWKETWESIREEMKPATDAWDNQVKPAWERLVTSFENSSPKIVSAMAEVTAFSIKQLGISLPTVFTNVGRSLTSMANIWDMTHESIISVVVGAYKVIFTVINTHMVGISAVIAAVLRIIEGIIAGWILLSQGDWEGWAANFKTTAIDVWEIFKEAVKTNLELVLGLFDTNLTEAKAFVDGLFDSMKTFWEWLQTHVFQVSLPTTPTGGPSLPTNPFGLGGGPTVSPPVTPAQAGGTYNNSNTTNMNYSPTYQGAPPSPQRDFAVMKVWTR